METNSLLPLSTEDPATFAAAMFEAWAKGKAVLPIDHRLPRDAQDALIEKIQPDLGVADGVALVVSTSGTTGTGSGVEITHAALAASMSSSSRYLGLTQQRWLCCLPLAHIAGLSTVIRSHLAGTEVIFGDAATPTKANAVSLVPIQLMRLLEADADLSHFDVALVGGGPVPAGLLDRALAAGVRAVATYGMTQMCGGCVYDGWSLPDVLVRVSDNDEIELQGPMSMRGYRLEAPLEGWLRTNDHGFIDEQGRLTVLGRIDDIIITGGHKVAPAEVEQILITHHRITDAAVLGVSDREWGQRVVALVVHDGLCPSLNDLRDFVSEHTARYKAPREVFSVDAIPRTSFGKMRRSALLELHRLSAKSAPTGSHGDGA